MLPMRFWLRIGRPLEPDGLSVVALWLAAAFGSANWGLWLGVVVVVALLAVIACFEAGASVAVDVWPELADEDEEAAGMRNDAMTRAYVDMICALR